MSNILDQMEKDFENQFSDNLDKLDTKELGSVAHIAKEIAAKEAWVADLEDQLKTAKQQLLKLTDEDLPTLLAELGLSKFTLDDGSEVTIKQTYGANIRSDRKSEAFDWLRDNGYDDIIKNTVACKFGRGEDSLAESFIEVASKAGFAVDQKTEVHPQTLRAFVKERVESGDEFPMEMFGAYIGQRAIIKRGK